MLIRDDTFERLGPNPSLLRGLDASHEIRGVVFENLMVGGRKCHSLEGARIDANGYVKGVSFE